MEKEILKRPVKPNEVRLGNYIDCLGKPEMVDQIIRIDDSSWYIGHSAIYQSENYFFGDTSVTCLAIPLTEAWKFALNIDKFKLPDWIKYVHEAQNYMAYFIGQELEINFTAVDQIARHSSFFDM